MIFNFHVNVVPFNVLYLEKLSFVACKIAINCLFNALVFQPVLLISYPSSSSSNSLYLLLWSVNEFWASHLIYLRIYELYLFLIVSGLSTLCLILLIIAWSRIQERKRYFIALTYCYGSYLVYGIKQAEKMGFYTESLFRCEIILLGHMIIYILVHLICVLWFWTILLSFYWQLLLQILLTSMFRLFVGHCSKNYGLFSTRATDSLYSFCQWCNLQCHTSTASIVWWHSNIRGTF